MSVGNEEQLLETVEIKENGGVLGSLGLNGQLFVFQLINFAIVSVIVWFLILKPLVKKMEERKKQIDDSLDNAKAIETALQMSDKKYQEKIDAAKVESNKIIKKANEDGEILLKKLKERAAQDIHLLVNQAKKNIAIDKQEMKEEIRKETAEMVVLAMEKIFDKKMDDRMDKKFISDILNNLNK